MTNTGYKGITKRGEDRFEAWIWFSNEKKKHHVGTYRTAAQAVMGRTQYLIGLI